MEKQIIKGTKLTDKELEVQEDGSLRIIEKKKGKFIPRDGQGFYFVDMFGKVKTLVFCEIDEELIWLIEHYPTFETGKECKEYKRYLELLDEYTCSPDWNNMAQNKYYLYYDHKDNEICWDFTKYIQTAKYYFTSSSKAKDFVKKAGESNINLFTFDIWE